MKHIGILFAALLTTACANSGEQALRPLAACPSDLATCFEMFGAFAEARDPARIVSRVAGPYGHTLAVTFDVEGRLDGGPWRRHRLHTRLDTGALGPHPGHVYAAAGASAIMTDRGVLEVSPESLRMGSDDALVLIHMETLAVTRAWMLQGNGRLGFLDLTRPVWMRGRVCAEMTAEGRFAARDWQQCHGETLIPLHDGDRARIDAALGGARYIGAYRIAATPYFTIERIVDR